VWSFDGDWTNLTRCYFIAVEDKSLATVYVFIKSLEDLNLNGLESQSQILILKMEKFFIT
jgi:hypothetical protein